jgi:hypothetical protein
MKNAETLTKSAKSTLRASLVLAILTLLTAAYGCSEPQSARINPVTRGSAGAISTRTTREDLVVMVNGKKWDGRSDVDSSQYKITGD